LAAEAAWPEGFPVSLSNCSEPANNVTSLSKPAPPATTFQIRFVPSFGISHRKSLAYSWHAKSKKPLTRVETLALSLILAAFITAIYHILGINMKLSLLLYMIICMLTFDV
jgi:hypothetical protein